MSGRADLPSLILAPKSVVPNWEKEAKKFAPALKVIALQGPLRKKYYPILKYCDLVVTSYPVLFRDADELLAQPFHFVVLDEAHTIKNTASQVTNVAYQIDARHRLCLSGTPIENHLGELWSLFHFLTPGFLGSEESFNRCFRGPIEKHRDEGLRKRLAERVAPLMLRRTKTLVAHDLPPKTEIVRTVELHPKQVELYEAVRAAVSREVHEEIARLGAEKSKLLVLDALLKLRQVCNHPQLLKLPSAQKVKSSAKMDLIMDWIPSMVKEGRRILIFSQFTGMLSIIEQALTKEGVRFLTLTGQSKDRGQLCDDFQAGKAPVFLISLRAGGTGLNLTAADTVIHFDPWWNPALEAQATDRAYRIGQKNPVFVYKLITAGTIEEKILMLQQKKRALFEGILEGTPQKLSFSEDELDDLLAPMK
jgi:SNF2 family DNA or RNA helicase